MQKLSDKKRVAGRKPKQLAASKTSSVRRFRDPLEGLQQTIGNHGVLLHRGDVIQPKLKIGAPNDKYEREADRVADMVMRMPGPRLQRQAENELEEEEEKEELIQAKARSGQVSEVTPDVEAQIKALHGSGQPLPQSTRVCFEPRFGYDFSQVRVHTDSRAHKMAGMLSAQAFTVGRDVVFGAGQYAPWTEVGRRLLTHELAHVVQQLGRATTSRQKPASCSLLQRQRDKSEVSSKKGRKARPSKETAQLIRVSKWVRETIYKNASPNKTDFLLGYLTTILRFLQVKRKVHNFFYLYQRIHGMTIHGDVQRLIDTGKLRDRMNTIKSRFPNLWPKEEWTPKMLPENWHEKSLERLKASNSWPSKVKGPEGDIILGGNAKIVQLIQFWGPWVIKYFDRLYAQGVITREEAKMLLVPYGDLVLVWLVRTKVWGQWLDINAMSVQPSILYKPATSTEKRGQLKAAKVAVPKMKKYRELFDKTPSGLSSNMTQLINARISKLEKSIKEIEGTIK